MQPANLLFISNNFPQQQLARSLPLMRGTALLQLAGLLLQMNVQGQSLPDGKLEKVACLRNGHCSK